MPKIGKTQESGVHTCLSCSGCYNIIPLARRQINNRNLFLRFCRLGSSRSMLQPMANSVSHEGLVPLS